MKLNARSQGFIEKFDWVALYVVAGREQRTLFAACEFTGF